MDIKNKVAVITGGASGIGAALAQRFYSEGAKAVVVADLDAEKVIFEVKIVKFTNPKKMLFFEKLQIVSLQNHRFTRPLSSEATCFTCLKVPPELAW